MADINKTKLIMQGTGETPGTRLITALDMSMNVKPKVLSKTAQFGFKAILQTPTVILTNRNIDNNGKGFDMEFDIPFDDDAIANEAKFVVYNLTESTANKFKVGNTIRLMAGYGADIGIIFDGYISKVKTVQDSVDRITTIYALDDVKYTPEMMDEKTYSEGVKASEILKDLLSRLNLPIEVFKPQRDHTYYDEIKVSGSIIEKIKEYSDVCGISTYICKQKIYCRPLWDGDNLHFNINSKTGMIGSPESFEKENQSEEYIDTINGYKITMVLQHRISTAGIVKLNSVNYSGEYRIVSGTHSFDGLSATTEFECINPIQTKIDVSKIESPNDEDTSDDDSSSGSAIDKAVNWAVSIANDSSHGYDQNSRWGPNYDCSSFLITAWEKAGVPVKSKGGATYTGNMRTAFINCGFEDVTSSITLSNGSGLQKGDVLLNTATHTVMYIGSGNIVHASINENGGTTGGKSGDQSGKEICTRSYYNKPWNYVLRYNE